MGKALNHTVQSSSPHLDVAFAPRFAPVGGLEVARLIRTGKVGRVRTCRLGPQGLAEVTAWLERYRQMWEARFAQLDDMLIELQHTERSDARRRTR